MADTTVHILTLDLDALPFEKDMTSIKACGCTCTCRSKDNTCTDDDFNLYCDSEELETLKGGDCRTNQQAVNMIFREHMVPALFFNCFGNIQSSG